MNNALQTVMIYNHDGSSDFPHGAGPSTPGLYVYTDTSANLGEPNGPFTKQGLADYLFELAGNPDEAE